MTLRERPRGRKPGRRDPGHQRTSVQSAQRPPGIGHRGRRDPRSKARLAPASPQAASSPARPSRQTRPATAAHARVSEHREGQLRVGGTAGPGGRPGERDPHRLRLHRETDNTSGLETHRSAKREKPSPSRHFQDPQTLSLGPHGGSEGGDAVPNSVPLTVTAVKCCLAPRGCDTAQPVPTGPEGTREQDLSE